MNIRPFSEWILYRHRYAIGYTLLAIMIGLYIGLYTGMLPPGLGPQEKQSIVTSAHISFSELPIGIVDLPYHILQKLSVEWLGVTPLGVRLPSFVFAGITAMLVVLILRRWFPSNVAIVAGAVVLSTGWFIGTARLGTPAIMVPFWTSMVLLATTYISQQTPNWKWWKVVLAFAAALSLYTPFMIYLYAAAIIASISQPHLRYLIHKSTSFQMTLGTLLFLLILAPLGWGLYKNIGQVWELLAIPATLPDPLQFGQSLFTALSNLFNPAAISFGEGITPLLSLAAAALLLMGGIRLLKDFHAVRSHVLLIWLAVLVPIIGFNPHDLIILLVPAMLVITIGVQLLIKYWYRLFPQNPYARIFGLLPLGLLILSIVQFNDQRFSYGMAYSEHARTTYSADAFMARDALAKAGKDTPVTLVAPENEQALYALVAAHYPKATVVSGSRAVDAPGTWLISASEMPHMATVPLGLPTQVVVNSHQNQSLRFLVYQR